jgi:hypothetical protein
MSKRIEREAISIEWEGETYTGYRIIEGTRKLFQTIHYKRHQEFDGHAYKPHETENMRAVAEIILGELVGRDQNQT